jgi:UPF0755 protein
MTDGQKKTLFARTMMNLVVIVVLVALIIAGWMYISYQRFQATPVTLASDTQLVEVPAGSSLQQLGASLHRQGIISSPRLFNVLGRELKAAHSLKVGEYVLRQGMTPRDVLLLMTEGKVVQHGLTLIEGHTFAEMLARIHAHPVIKVTLQDLDGAAIMEKLGHSGEHPEGRFLADTYHFPRHTTDVEFLQRAYAAMQSALAEAWATRADGLPLKSPYEALILASIVEKETGKAEERATIAGVFVRRLQKGMRLQTDPTVIYGLGETFDGNLRRRDLVNDTPYNTYTRHGLPPTPIAMPGTAALQAVMHPADGDSLYFVSRGDGSHYFSATLREHELAVDKFQRGKRGITLPQEKNNQ